MKRAIAAATIAISSLLVTSMPSYADSVTIRIGEPGYNHRPYYHDRYYRDRHNAHYRHCWTQPYQVKISHGREVTKYRQVCR